MLSNKKIILIVVLFLTAITGMRLTWLGFQKTIEHPQAINGVLDLRGWPIPENHTITLNGEWEFFPSRLIRPETDGKNAVSSVYEKKFIQVPGKWNHAFPTDADASFHYGTYRLRILLDDHKEQNVILRINEIRTASAVYINGRFAAGEGHPAERRDLHQARHVPYSVTLPHGSNVIEMIIQVSNHAGDGGITQPIRLGSVEAVDHRSLFSMGLQFMLCIVFFIHGIYAVMLYFLGAANKGMLLFSLLIFSAIVTVLVSDDKLLLIWFPLPYEIFLKIALLSYIGTASCLPPLLNHMYPDCGSPKLLRWFAVYCIAYSMFVLFAPSQYAAPSIKIFLAATLLISVFISGSILQSAVKKKEDVIYLLLGCTAFAANVMWTIIKGRASIHMMHYPFDLMIAVFCFAAFWFKRFFRANLQTKQLAEKLQTANQQKDEFLVNTSHELRIPLHGIINITQSVLDDADNPANDDHRKRLELQVAVSKRMSLMLDNLLDVARLKENTIRLQIAKLRVQSVVAGVHEMFRFMLEGKPIRFRIGIDDAFPPVLADENRVIQIMFNLLHNAIKFTDEGEIAVRATIKNGLAHIHISDTGIGMDEETQRTIFLPYEQGRSNMERASAGFGLGLSICKQLVELHGGTIKVESALGQGTVFTFTLPLSEGAEYSEDESPLPAAVRYEAAAAGSDMTGAAFASASTAGASKPKLLVVDDDSINLKIVAEILGAAQYRISTATSALEAIAKLEKEHYDLMISDVMMPHISGYELTRIIRERFSVSELPILLLTARSRSEDIVAGFQSGANDYVTKPVDSWELRSRVRALTELKLSIEERMRLEAAWLQSQIQPHFLFNTLNSIAALGTMDMAKMQMLLEQFSNYLRMSIDFHNSDRIVSIERELALVRSYLYIEKERFGERLDVQWRLDANISFLLPPLSIQTLVENAVNHGILRRSRGGTIHIRITDEKDHINICISDDGVGMNEETWEQALKLSGSGNGIGLRNTDRRLKQLYGKGLQIRSAPGQGTVVAFQVPKQ
ncbi:ATP-binding protein [Paenibacillus thermotolerans]|uniref:ATP-binding protein n=1 Tax=Paenibacillus thermotolerans TaxID=3027807 RepID=UPI0023680A62|nr:MULTISPECIES: ATP-binding protein [unclassified Paenibacillus]